MEIQSNPALATDPVSTVPEVAVEPVTSAGPLDFNDWQNESLNVTICPRDFSYEND